MGSDQLVSRGKISSNNQILEQNLDGCKLKQNDDADTSKARKHYSDRDPTKTNCCTQRVAKTIFSLHFNKITTHLRRSPTSLPHLV
jgi:hypothetical protein